MWVVCVERVRGCPLILALLLFMYFEYSARLGLGLEASIWRITVTVARGLGSVVSNIKLFHVLHDNAQAKVLMEPEFIVWKVSMDWVFLFAFL